MSRLLFLLRRAFVSTYEDGLLGIAKAAAYSSLLSFFPGLTTIAAILVQANAEAVSRILARFITRLAPPGTQSLIEVQFALPGARPVSLLVVASVISVWAASGVTASLMEGFRAAYRIPTGRGILKDRLVAILLVFTTIFPILGVSSFIVFGDRIEQAVMTTVGLLQSGEQLKGWVAVISRMIRILVTILAFILILSLQYYLGPNRKQTFSGVLPGALVGTAIWYLLTQLFGWYVRNLANYNVVYGSVGGAIALLVWMYLLSLISLYGCEFNAEHERLLPQKQDSAYFR